MIHFDSSVPESKIQAIKNEVKCIEIWVATNCKIRLWESTTNDPLKDLRLAKKKAPLGTGSGDLNHRIYAANDDISYRSGAQCSYNTTLSTGRYSARVAVIDGGYKSFGGSVVKQVNYTDESSTYDYSNHGNAMNSLIRKASSNSSRIKYDIRKVLDKYKRGYLSDFVKAVDDSLTDGAEIINASVEYNSAIDGADDLLYELIYAIKNKRALLVVAAGNGSKSVSKDKDVFPAAVVHPNVITVASVDCNGRLASHSNYGTSAIDIAGPGIGLLSPTSSGNLFLTGTSGPTALVSGIAAAMRTHSSSFNPQNIVCRLKKGVDAYTSLKYKVRGVVNASKAFSSSCSSYYYSAYQKEEGNINSDTPLFPNPAHSSVFVKIKPEHNKLEIIDMTGKVQYSKILTIYAEQTYEINEISNLVPGIYILRVHSNATSDVESIRFVKQ